MLENTDRSFKTRARRRITLALTISLFLLLGCSDCPKERCAYPTVLLLVHHKEAGDYLPEASVSEGNQPVELWPGDYCRARDCTHAFAPKQNAATIVVDLPGTRSATFSMRTSADSCGRPEQQKIVVKLSEREDAEVSEPTIEDHSCGGID